MAGVFQASRDVIIRTDHWHEALHFYATVLGLPLTRHSDTLAAFETGGFCLYVEKGAAHGPVFEFLVPDVQAAKRCLLAAGGTLIDEDASVPRCYIRDPFGLVYNVGSAPSGY
jgi:catechol 2,3-dioxygenase-like lactoylglutathione lyase family enzyme